MTRHPLTAYLWSPNYEDDHPDGTLARMRIADLILRATVFFYRTREDAEGLRNACGSGFVVSIEEDDGLFRYIVTNGHVVNGITAGGGTIVVSLITTRDEPKIFDTSPRDWHYKGDSDIAVCPLLRTHVNAFSGVASISSNFSISEEVIAEDQFGVGDPVYMTGKFVGIEAKIKINPVGRFGNVAMMPGEPIHTESGSFVCFVVEMRSIAGYSGAPTIVYKPTGSPIYLNRNTIRLRKEPTYRLLGVNAGHVRHYTDAHSKQTGKIRVKMNSAMSLVMPAWKLTELLYSPTLAKMRKRATEAMRKQREGPDASVELDSSLPFPDSGFTPDLQRTLKRKLESGEVDEVDEDAFFGSMGRAVPPEPLPGQDDEAP
jgi:hypothetical protein